MAGTGTTGATNGDIGIGATASRTVILPAAGAWGGTIPIQIGAMPAPGVGVIRDRASALGFRRYPRRTGLVKSQLSRLPTCVWLIPILFFGFPDALASMAM